MTSNNNQTLLPISPWPVQWVHGSNGEPALQVHRVCDGLFAIRQSKLLNFEGNFIYIVVGHDRAIIVDTGAVSAAQVGLVACVERVLMSMNLFPLPLVVAHTHSHGDHTQGDTFFQGLENVQIVGHGIEAVSKFFALGVPSDESTEEPDIALFELGGGRTLKVFFVPGHCRDHIVLYDCLSGVLLTGDFLYRGRLYVEDRSAFERSTRWVDDFANRHTITAVLGSHIEMTSSPGVDYPDGTLFQPEEPPLSMDVTHIRQLREVVERAAGDHPGRWGEIRTRDFIVVPSSLHPSEAAQERHITRIALLRRVFYHQQGGGDMTEVTSTPQEKLIVSLLQARALGASVVVLPELPMDRWYPLSPTPSPGEVCEDGLNDPRIVAMSQGARAAGVVLVGGALLRARSLPEHLRNGISSGTESDINEMNCVRNVTLIFNSTGEVIATHMKRHLPKEAGFWEGAHFEAPPGGPTVIGGVVPGMLVGVQTCSDIMRPSSFSLAALGAGLIINPRATEAASSQRWERVLCGIAVTSASYIISVPRPAAEGSVDLGGDAFALSPTGDVLVSLSSASTNNDDSNDLCTCDVDPVVVGRARVETYPGYLDVRAEEYAAAWTQVSAQREAFSRGNF